MNPNEYDQRTLEAIKLEVLNQLTSYFGYMMFLATQQYSNIHTKARIEGRVYALTEFYAKLSGLDVDHLEDEDEMQILVYDAVKNNYLSGFQGDAVVMKGLHAEFGMRKIG